MAYYPIATEAGAAYTLTGPDGSVAAFNDPFSPNYVGMLTEVTGLDSAEVRESASDLTEADGGAHGAFYFGRRPIVMTGRVFGHTSIAARDLRLDRARRASLALRGDAVLTWKPSQREENLVPNPKPLTGGWTANAASTNPAIIWADDPTAPNTGKRMTLSDPANTDYFVGVTGSSMLVFNHGVRPGETVTVSADIQANAAALATTGTALPHIRLYWRRPDGGYSSVATAYTGPADTWQRISCTLTVPADATSFFFRLYNRNNTGSVGSGAVTSFSAVRLARGTSSTYGDGDLSTWNWQYAKDASTSGNFLELFTTVRRQQPFRESGGWVKEFQIALVSQYATIQSSALITVGTGVPTENRGNYPAYPLIEITGASANPTVSVGGLTFRTAGLTLASGEKVQFDMLNHSGQFTAGPRAGQSANRYIDFTNTQWPYLSGLGASQHFSMTGGGSTSASYRHTWA